MCITDTGPNHRIQTVFVISEPHLERGFRCSYYRPDRVGFRVLVKQLSGLDASFLYLETQNAPLHIGSFAIYDQSTAPGGRVTFKGILANVESRLHLARCFRQKLARAPFDLDHPYWIEDPDFDLEFHVRHIAVPQPGDWRQLCIQIARLHARPLDLSKPLWEMYVIEGLDNVDGAPPGSFAIMTKIHHAAIDGVSGAELATAIHDLEPHGSAPPPEKSWVPERDPSFLELGIRTAVNNVTNPFRLARSLRRNAPGLARLFRGHGAVWRKSHAGHVSLDQLKVMSAIERCRTAQLGGHVLCCTDCGEIQIAYNSCRNRHCPKCQASAAKRWLDARMVDLLPVDYYHMVFTLPAPIADIAYQNKAVIYNILFKAAAETLATIAADPKHLGARIGMTMVLHTWGSALTHHPHVHCIVPGGGFSKDGKQWVDCRDGYYNCCLAPIVQASVSGATTAGTQRWTVTLLRSVSGTGG